jgi:hypothetical protein
MTHRRRTSRLRDDFYKAARTLGDVEWAAERHGTYTKPRVRKVAHRRTKGAFGRVLRALGR